MDRVMMDVERSVFGIAEPRRLYAIGMAISLAIHLLVACIIVIAPKLTPPKQFSDIKAYQVKIVSADQVGSLPKVGAKAPSVSEVLTKAMPRESGSSKEGIPIYSARKISVPIEDRSSRRAELQPIETSPPAISPPKPSQQSSAQWETLVPNISVRKNVKPIEQRREFLKEKEQGEAGDTKTSKAEQAPSRTSQQNEGVSGSASHGTKSQVSDTGSAGAGAGKAEKQGGTSGDAPQSAEEYGLARKLYYSEVWKAIQSQWAVPVEILNRDDLEAILVIKIRRDGTITDVRFEKKSGNEIFDSSVWKAVQKANPLPPFPKSYSPPYEEIGIRFRPKDLARR